MDLWLDRTTTYRILQFLKKVVRWLISIWWFYLFGGAAAVTLLVLIHLQPAKASITFHLAERVVQVLVTGGWLFTVLAWRSLPRYPDREIQVVAGKGATEVLRIWRRGLLLVPVWLAAAVGHMVAHYRSEAVGAATFGGFLTNAGTYLELQMLGLQALLLVVVLVGVAIEAGLPGTKGVGIRPHLVVVTFLAALASSLSEVASIVSPEAFLIAVHVLAMSSWCGGLLGAVSWAARVNARTVLQPVIYTFSEVAAVAAVTVFVTGVALGLDWTDHEGLVHLTRSLEGHALIVKAGLGALLVGVLGYLQRRFALPRLLGSDPLPKVLFLGLGAIELAIMAVAIVLGVAI